MRLLASLLAAMVVTTALASPRTGEYKYWGDCAQECDQSQKGVRYICLGGGGIGPVVGEAADDERGYYACSRLIEQDAEGIVEVTTGELIHGWWPLAMSYNFPSQIEGEPDDAFTERGCTVFDFGIVRIMKCYQGNLVADIHQRGVWLSSRGGGGGVWNPKYVDLVSFFAKMPPAYLHGGVYQPWILKRDVCDNYRVIDVLYGDNLQLPCVGGCDPNDDMVCWGYNYTAEDIGDYGNRQNPKQKLDVNRSNSNQTGFWSRILQAAIVPSDAQLAAAKASMTEFVSWGPFGVVQQLSELGDVSKLPQVGEPDLTLPIMGPDGGLVPGSNSAGQALPVGMSKPRSASGSTIDWRAPSTAPGISFVRAAMGASVYLAFAMYLIKALMPKQVV